MSDKRKNDIQNNSRLMLVIGILLGALLMGIIGVIGGVAFFVPVGSVTTSVTQEFGSNTTQSAPINAQQQPTIAPQGTVIANRVQAAQLAPDGERVITAVQEGSETLLYLHQLRVDNNLSASTQLFKRLSVTSIDALHINPQGNAVAVIGDEAVRVVSLMPDNLTQATFDSYNAAAFSPDGQYLAVGGGGEGVRLLDASSGQYQLIRSSVPTENAHIYTLAFNQRNQLAVARTSNDGTLVDVYDVSSLDTPVNSYPLPSGYVYDMAFHPDGDWLAVAGLGSVEAIDLSSGERSSYSLNAERVHAVEFSADGGWLVAGGGSSGIGEAALLAWRWQQVGDLIAPDPTYYDAIELTGHAHVVHDVTFTPDGEVLSASFDGSVRLWQLPEGILLSEMRL